MLAQRSHGSPHSQQPWMWRGSLLSLHWSPETQAVSTEGTSGCWCVSPACVVGDGRGGPCRLRRTRACSHGPPFPPPPARTLLTCWALALVCHPQLCGAQVLTGPERAVAGGQRPCRTGTGSERSAGGVRAVAGCSCCSGGHSQVLGQVCGPLFVCFPLLFLAFVH